MIGSAADPRFSVLGPGSGVGSGNLIIVMESQTAYMAKTISKCQREGYKSFQVKQSAVDSFLKYSDDYFARTVFSDNCKSWYKGGKKNGAIRTLWPGSSSHLALALKHPRWEDYDWERLPEYEHPMSWLGDGHIPAYFDPAFYYDDLRSQHAVRKERSIKLTSRSWRSSTSLSSTRQVGEDGPFVEVE